VDTKHSEPEWFAPPDEIRQRLAGPAVSRTRAGVKMSEGTVVFFVPTSCTRPRCRVGTPVRAIYIARTHPSSYPLRTACGFDMKNPYPRAYPTVSPPH